MCYNDFLRLSLAELEAGLVEVIDARAHGGGPATPLYKQGVSLIVDLRIQEDNAKWDRRPGQLFLGIARNRFD